MIWCTLHTQKFTIKLLFIGVTNNKKLNAHVMCTHYIEELVSDEILLMQILSMNREKFLIYSEGSNVTLVSIELWPENQNISKIYVICM